MEEKKTQSDAQPCGIATDPRTGQKTPLKKKAVSNPTQDKSIYFVFRGTTLFQPCTFNIWTFSSPPPFSFSAKSPFQQSSPTPSLSHTTCKLPLQKIPACRLTKILILRSTFRFSLSRTNSYSSLIWFHFCRPLDFLSFHYMYVCMYVDSFRLVRWMEKKSRGLRGKGFQKTDVWGEGKNFSSLSPLPFFSVILCIAVSRQPVPVP